MKTRDCVRNLRLSGTPLLAQPSTITEFAGRGFSHSVPTTVWNPLSGTSLTSLSLTVLNLGLKLSSLTWLKIADTVYEVATSWRNANVCIIVRIINGIVHVA